jgi:SAM-dependent methyltransferase
MSGAVETYLVDGKKITADECRRLFANGTLGDRQVRVLDRIEGDLVLDIGCYAGIFVRQASRRYPQKTIIGTDYFEDHIRLAHLLYPDMWDRFRLMSVYSLDFPDASVDCIALQEVLEHLEGAAQAVKEINRALKVGGAFVLSVPNPYYWRNLVSVARAELLNSWRRRRGKATRLMPEIFYDSVEWNRHIYAWTPPTLLALLTGNGFEYVDHCFENGLPNPLERWMVGIFEFFGPTLIMKVRKVNPAPSGLV